MASLPSDVAAAFQMLYPRVIDHAPLYISFALWVYVFRVTTVSFRPTLHDDRAFLPPSSNQAVLNFHPIFRSSFDSPLSISPKEYTATYDIYIYTHAHGPTLLKLDFPTRVSNYYQPRTNTEWQYESIQLPSTRRCKNGIGGGKTTRITCRIEEGGKIHMHGTENMEDVHGR